MTRTTSGIKNTTVRPLAGTVAIIRRQDFYHQIQSAFPFLYYFRFPSRFSLKIKISFETSNGYLLHCLRYSLSLSANMSGVRARSALLISTCCKIGV
jgi:hypothetical protein